MNKVVNFAQGDLGTAPAVLAVGLMGLSGVNYFLGLATGLVGAVILTAALEILVVRRFRRSPRLILTVATIGLSQALVVLSLLIPRIWGQTPISTAVINFPWHATWRLEPVVLTADDLVAVIVSLACLAAVSFWFTRSDMGIAVQATGDRRDRASMLGIPVGRLQSFTWVVAGVLSFVSIFFQAAIVGMPLDPTFGLTALVTALAALALGNFSDLPSSPWPPWPSVCSSRGWRGTTRPTLPSGSPSSPPSSSPRSSCASSWPADRPRGGDDPHPGRERPRPDSADRALPEVRAGHPARHGGGLRRGLHASSLARRRRAGRGVHARRARRGRVLGRRAHRMVGPGQPGPDVLRRRRRRGRRGGAARLALGPEPGAAALRRGGRRGRLVVVASRRCVSTGCSPP